MPATASISSSIPLYRPQSIEETRLETWFERDRAYVALCTLDGTAIVSWWDEAVAEAIEDGSLEPRSLHESAYEYARHLRLVGSAQ
ncbi:MAG: hypothetical protein ACRD4R_08590 [Candidatus Acidiferrales bacterium]